MYHSEATINAHLPEPPDGTRLVIETDTDGDAPEYKVIWRDDAEAKRRGAHPDDRWFDDDDSDPMRLYAHVRYTTAVYPLGQPLVRFADSDEVAS